jgi:hypothetical protein
MGDKKISKISYKFICVSCDYKCSKQSEYNKHNLTAKHQKNTERLQEVTTEMTEKPPVKYICKCGNEYFHRQGLSRHKKECKIGKEVNEEVNDDLNKPDTRYKTDEPNNKIVNLLIENNKQLQDNNKQLQYEMKEFKNIIIQLLSENKEQNQEQTAAILELTKNGITNNTNNTTNNINKTFNIQIYLNETCKDAVNIEDFVKNITITNEDLLTYAEYDFGKATPDIIVKNLKPLKKFNFPFHCSNIQDKTIYTKSLNTWLKDEGELFQKMVINGIQRKLLVQFMVYRDEFPECKKSSSHLSNKYNKFTVSINSNCDKIFNNKILLNVIKNIIIPK